MEDTAIMELYFARDQEAIAETDRKYGPLCTKVSYGILSNLQDAEECVADTYLAAWNSIPPQRPDFLKAYLLKITRNLSLMRLRRRYARKNGRGEVTLVLEELGDTFASDFSVERIYEGREVARAVSCFLRTLPETDRNMFLIRYWYMTPVADIAAKMGCKESRVKTSLFRTRKKLQNYLTKEGLV